jgi:hypothetical protein
MLNLPFACSFILDFIQQVSPIRRVVLGSNWARDLTDETAKGSLYPYFTNSQFGQFSPHHRLLATNQTNSVASEVSNLTKLQVVGPNWATAYQFDVDYNCSRLLGSIQVKTRIKWQRHFAWLDVASIPFNYICCEHPVRNHLSARLLREALLEHFFCSSRAQLARDGL